MKLSVICGLLLLALPAFGSASGVLVPKLNKSGDEVVVSLTPSYSAGNATIVSASIVLLLPSNTLIEPEIRELPGSGGFRDLNGSWSVTRMSAAVLEAVGADPALLDGVDLYTATLRPGSLSTDLTAGQRTPLFSFSLPKGCPDGLIQVVSNESPLINTLRNQLGANFANYISAQYGSLRPIDQFAATDSTSLESSASICQ